MAKKEYLCDSCKYFTDKCEHISNVIVCLHKQVEKIQYRNIDKCNKCYFYIERH